MFISAPEKKDTQQSTCLLSPFRSVSVKITNTHSLSRVKVGPRISSTTYAAELRDVTDRQWVIVARRISLMQWEWFIPAKEVPIFRRAVKNGYIISPQGTGPDGDVVLYAKRARL